MTQLFPQDLIESSEALLERYRQAGKRIVTAESCTGGLLAGLLTEIPGSSDVVERGFVTYSNEAKHDLVGVPLEVLRAKGAVSAETARAMAMGALCRASADVAVSVTGIAGPGGATPDKPVGLVYFGLAAVGDPPSHSRRVFGGDRGGVRLSSVREALSLLSEKVA
jgi:nicotinamide-nucleotide amidase